MDVNKVLSGTDGKTWINGQLLGTLSSIEAKVTGTFEEVSFCGDPATYNRYMGWSGEGALAFRKIDSTVLELLANAYQEGVMPDIKIITKLKDRGSQKAERVALTGVTFTEFMLAKFETKTLINEELPFKFSNFEILERIA